MCIQTKVQTYLYKKYSLNYLRKSLCIIDVKYYGSTILFWDDVNYCLKKGILMMQENILLQEIRSTVKWNFLKVISNSTTGNNCFEDSYMVWQIDLGDYLETNNRLHYIFGILYPIGYQVQIYAEREYALNNSNVVLFWYFDISCFLSKFS